MPPKWKSRVPQKGARKGAKIRAKLEKGGKKGGPEIDAKKGAKKSRLVRLAQVQLASFLRPAWG